MQHPIADGCGIPVRVYDTADMRRRIPTINLIIVAVIVMMLCIPMVFFRFRMMMANKVGIILIFGVVMVIGVLARMGGDHKARRLSEEKRRKELTARKSGRKQK